MNIIIVSALYVLFCLLGYVFLFFWATSAPDSRDKWHKAEDECGVESEKFLREHLEKLSVDNLIDK